VITVDSFLSLNCPSSVHVMSLRHAHNPVIIKSAHYIQTPTVINPRSHCTERV